MRLGSNVYTIYARRAGLCPVNHSAPHGRSEFITGVTVCGLGLLDRSVLGALGPDSCDVAPLLPVPIRVDRGSRGQREHGVRLRAKRKGRLRFIAHDGSPLELGEDLLRFTVVIGAGHSSSAAVRSAFR